MDLDRSLALNFKQFDRDGLTDLIGANRFFNHLETAVATFHEVIGN